MFPLHSPAQVPRPASPAYCCVPYRPRWPTCFRITGGSSATRVEYHRVEILPGKEAVLADLQVPSKITYFYFTDDSFLHPAEGSGFMYPGLVLKIT